MDSSPQEFRNWKGKWLLAERKLRDSPHVTDEVLQTQLLNALSGEAHNTVSDLSAGSIDKAMEQLTAKFGDSFRLAASYIPATGGEAGTTKKQMFRAAAAMVGNLELVLPELEAQDIAVKDFFVIHLELSSLLAPAQRAWHLHNEQERRTQPPHTSLEWRRRLLSLGRGVKSKRRRLKHMRMRTPV